MNTNELDMNLAVLDTGELTVAYPPLDFALANWADATTDPTSDRRKDLLRDKTKAVSNFFEWICKPVAEVSPADIKTWQKELEQRNLIHGTIYGRIGRISSFYAWLMKSPDMAGWVIRNPVTLARPKAPKAYQSESTKAIDDDRIRAMVQLIKARVDVVGKRDYALFLFFLLSSLHRNEVAQLRWKDLQLNGGMEVTNRAEGGEIITREIANMGLIQASLDYLDASGRLSDMQTDSPIWTRHDRAGKPGARLSSHSISKSFKRYAKDVDVDSFHLYQFRHTSPESSQRNPEG